MKINKEQTNVSVAAQRSAKKTGEETIEVGKFAI